MGVPVDPLYDQYVVQKEALLGHGADGGVVRGVDKQTLQWHALKYLSRHAYSPQREVDTMRMLKHPNIVSLLRAFAPAGTPRPQWVLAMPGADFTLVINACRCQPPCVQASNLGSISPIGMN